MEGESVEHVGPMGKGAGSPVHPVVWWRCVLRRSVHAVMPSEEARSQG